MSLNKFQLVCAPHLLVEATLYWYNRSKRTGHSEIYSYCWCFVTCCGFLLVDTYHITGSSCEHRGISNRGWSVDSPHKGPVMQKSIPLWRHQMETFSALLAICAGNSPVPGEFPAQRPVTRSFDVFFDLRLNKRFSKQSWGWWFETLPRPLWRHSNAMTSSCVRVSLELGRVMQTSVVRIGNPSEQIWTDF